MTALCFKIRMYPKESLQGPTLDMNESIQIEENIIMKLLIF